MPYIEWSDDLLLGIERIDEQHKHLFELINTLADAIDHKRPKEDINTVFGEMNGYILNHFRLEENLFAQYGYHAGDDHAHKHRIFEDRLHELQSDFLIGNPATPHELLLFLGDWWTTHIKKIDAAYAPFLKDAGAN